MCTQYITAKSREEIARMFTARVSPLYGSYGEVQGEAFPGRLAPVIGRVRGESSLSASPGAGAGAAEGVSSASPGASASAGRGLTAMRWGWPPPPGVKGPVVNVRNIASPFWRAALTNPARRCLVPVARFCEWGTGEDGKKQRHWFDVAGREMFAFAGVWRAVSSDDAPVYAFLTCEPNPMVGVVHPKAMPVILHEADYDRWLDAPVDEAVALAAPFPSQLMREVAGTDERPAASSAPV